MISSLAIVQFEGRLLGTAFFISKDLLLTAGHILRGLEGKKLDIVPHQATGTLEVAILGSSYPTEANGELDYAILKVVSEDFAPRRPISLSTRKYAGLQQFRGYGYYNENERLVCGPLSGTIDGEEYHRYGSCYRVHPLFRVQLCQSGSPLCDSKGKVFAIQSSREQDGGSLKTWATPVRRVVAMEEVVNAIHENQKIMNRRRYSSNKGYEPQLACPPFRIVLFVRPLISSSFGFSFAAEIQKRLEKREKSLANYLQKSVWLREAANIKWKVDERVAHEESEWGDVIAADSSQGPAQEELVLLRVVVDSDTPLPNITWAELKLPHEKVTHGMTLKTVAEGRSDLFSVGTFRVSNKEELEEVLNQVTSRIIDLFLDINVFYRFENLASIYNTVSKRQRFEQLKCDYLLFHQNGLGKVDKIASMARASWRQLPDTERLKLEWRTFMSQVILPDMRGSRENTIEDYIASIEKEFKLRPSLSGSIGRKQIRNRLNQFGLDNLRGAILMALIVEKPTNGIDRENLIKLFKLSVWQMKSKSLAFFKLEHAGTLEKFGSDVLVIPVNP